MSDILTYSLAGALVSSPIWLYGIYNWVYTRGYCAGMRWVMDRIKVHDV